MKSDLLTNLRHFALSFPDTKEGIACEGTALEKCTIKVRNKAFVFLGKSEVMLKLADSIAEAKAIAKENPDGLKVGTNGWVTVKCGKKAPIPLRTLEVWIEESYCSFRTSSVLRKRVAKAPRKKPKG